jgi:nicotinamidase/pyrazinamidase
VLDGLKEGFRVKALKNAMRPVELKPGDGDRAIADMQNAGAEIQEQEAGAAGR